MSLRLLYLIFVRLCGWLVLLGVQIVLLVQSPAPSGLRWAALGGTAVVALAHLVVMPQWRYRVHRWEATSDAVSRSRKAR